MPYSSNFVLTTVKGTFGTGSGVLEHWQATWKIPLSTAPSGAALAAYLAAIEAPVKAYHGDGNVKAGTQTFLTELTAAHLGTDGHYTGGGAQTTTSRIITPAFAGAGSPVNSFADAIVISLRTQFARGLASHGRIYWPAQAVVCGTDGVIGVSQAAAIATSAKTLLDAVNAAAAAQLSTTNKVSVMSQVGAGQTAPVTKVLVGVKVDRQERREKSISENWQPATLATTLEIVEATMDLPVDELPGGVGVRPRR